MKPVSFFRVMLCGIAPLTVVAEPDSKELDALRAEVAALAKTVRTLQNQLETQEHRWACFNAPATHALSGTGPDVARECHHAEGHAHRHEADPGGEHRHDGIVPFHPDISATIDFITSYSREANQWNFTLRNVEILIQQKIDSFARAAITLNAESELAATENNALFEHTSIAVEEAVIETTSLPWGFQLRAGQFFADFSRLGKVHAHELPFIDRPLSLEQILGGETVARGFELSWAPPTPHPFRLTAGLVDHIGAEPPVTHLLGGGAEEDSDGHHHGESAFEEPENRPFKALTAYVRGATSFELTPQTVLRVGADYAQKRQGTKRQIASADAVLEWQPDPARPDRLEVGTEGLWTREHGPLNDEAAPLAPATGTATAWGGYAYAQYRIGTQWQPGVRVDYLHANTYQHPEAGENATRSTADTWTWSAYLTYHMSEANRLRLQLNYVESSQPLTPNGSRNDLQAFFQWTVFFGTHQHPPAP